MLDYVIVGAGLFGATFAREMKDAGKTCLVIEKQIHLGGNCYTEEMYDIMVHMHGPHIFHTNNESVMEYVKQFATFNMDYTHEVKALTGGKLYSLPINRNTLDELGIDQLVVSKPRGYGGSNLEEWIVSQVGRDIYQKFFYHYTKKQWGREPKDLPASIIKRLPIRNIRNNNYYDHKYSGIPVGGYTNMIETMLDGITVALGVNYFDNRRYFDELAKRVVFTGPIDRFFDYEFGRLEYRSLRFQHELLQVEHFQPVAQVNYTGPEEKFTRIVEHKHFGSVKTPHTLITKEFPLRYGSSRLERYYPVNDEKNNVLYERYKKIIDGQKYLFGGRLATYKYFDMDQVVASAIAKAKKEIK
jgi:UDP-galactopyranose mutase